MRRSRFAVFCAGAAGCWTGALVAMVAYAASLAALVGRKWCRGEEKAVGGGGGEARARANDEASRRGGAVVHSTEAECDSWAALGVSRLR